MNISSSVLQPSPFTQMEEWLKQAEQKNIVNYNAMSLSTSTKKGKPSIRTVLLKSFDRKGLKFFTNLNSRKVQDISENPYAAALFYWRELERQLTVEGAVEQLARQEAESYFRSRPRKSQIAAWASQQGQPVSSREEMEEAFNYFEETFKNQEVPLPDFWGGFCLIPSRFEFWIEKPFRFHDRFEYILNRKDWHLRRIFP